MPPYRATGSPPASIMQWRDTGLAFCRLGAASVTAIIRPENGLSYLSGIVIFVDFVALRLLNAICNFQAPLVGAIEGGAEDNSLKYFAWLFLVMAIWQRRRAWKALRGGTPWHGESIGVSRLEFLSPWIRIDWIYRFVEPASIFLLGRCLSRMGWEGLGLWLSFAALCLFLIETRARELRVELALGVVNSTIESEAQAAIAARFSGPVANPKPLSRRETGGIPTGIDPLLGAQIAKRVKSRDLNQPNQGENQ